MWTRWFWAKYYWAGRYWPYRIIPTPPPVGTFNWVGTDVGCTTRRGGD